MKKTLFVLVFALLLTACGGSSTPTAAPAAQTEAPATAIEAPISLPFPSGRFIKSGETDYGLLFGADKTFSVFQGDSTFVHATFKVEGDVFTETSNDGGCETNVSFNYVFDGANLTFSYVGNPDDDQACAGRNADFNNVTYVFTPVSLPFPSGKFIKSGTTDYGFTFNEDGTYTRFEDSVSATKGTYSMDGNIYTETFNDGGCPTNISFTYTFDGKNLIFNYVGNPADDGCGNGGRRADFDNVTYTLSDVSEANFPTGKFIKEGTTQYGLRFNEDGTFHVFDGDTIFVNATYTADDSTFTETSNTGGCDTNVSFNYAFDGKNLTFTYVGNPDDDKSCDGRHADFNNVTYTLAEE